MIEIVKDLSGLKRMTFDEQMQLLEEQMLLTQRAITELARRVKVWYERINKRGEEIKSLKKVFVGKVAEKELVKDILKGDAESMLDKRFFEKERSKIKQMTDRWYVI